MRPAFPVGGMVLCGLSACARLWYVRRPVDSTPSPWQVSEPLPPGEVRATLEMNTGGDQMSVRPVEAGLELIVQKGDQGWRWRLDSCRDLGWADVMVEGDPKPPAFACDGVLWDLNVLSDRVEVTRNGKVFGAVPLAP